LLIALERMDCIGQADESKERDMTFQSSMGMKTQYGRQANCLSDRQALRGERKESNEEGREERKGKERKHRVISSRHYSALPQIDRSRM
jgi:hypothetical protein